MDELTTLERALAEVAAPYVADPPRTVSAERVRSSLAEIGLVAPPGLIDWFGWRNGDGTPQAIKGPGVLTTTNNRFLGWMIAMTLDDCVRSYVSMQQFGEIDPDFFRPEWFPFLLLEHRGGMVCIDCQRQPGSILQVEAHIFRPEKPEDRIFDSISDFASTMTAGLRDGWINTNHTSSDFLHFDVDAAPAALRPTLLWL